MSKPVTNLPASIHQRLLNIARERGQIFDVLLVRYALERFLYRLGQTEHSAKFVLKGAMLITSWFNTPFRATRDLDVLAFGDPSREAMYQIFRDVFAISMDDGLVFDPATLIVETNREDAEYGGLKLTATAFLSRTRIPLVIDVGFGDATVPEPLEITLPVLLEHPAPRLRAYAPETVIAEKFEAMVKLGRANSRMKDFYDIWMLWQAGQYDQEKLPLAIAATFQRRNTPIPLVQPDALTPEFAADKTKQKQWQAFLRNNLGDTHAALPGLAELIEGLAAFLMPHAVEAEFIQRSQT